MEIKMALVLILSKYKFVRAPETEVKLYNTNKNFYVADKMFGSQVKFTVKCKVSKNPLLLCIICSPLF